jgi:micrococcal nuclease
MNKFLSKYQKRIIYFLLLLGISLPAFFKNRIHDIENKYKSEINTRVDENKVTIKEEKVEINSENESPDINDKNDLPDQNLNQVINVVDGDTIDVDINGKEERLRMIGVNTPETVDPRRTVECFGKEASNKTKELLSGKSVYLESDATQGDRDKYGRLLRYIFMEDGTNYNYWLISNGYAFEYTYNLPYKYQSEFKNAQEFAEINKLGLWAPNTCIK